MQPGDLTGEVLGIRKIAFGALAILLGAHAVTVIAADSSANRMSGAE